ncbi:hypothetical protein [Virgibacillus sp. DJP39]|uniref:hypothetical protein n=1 Tax=Virgibacillus sp. DJP39 TaxID=3409790 RepID=UPI003BB5170C
MENLQLLSLFNQRYRLDEVDMLHSFSKLEYKGKKLFYYIINSLVTELKLEIENNPNDNEHLRDLFHKISTMQNHESIEDITWLALNDYSQDFLLLKFAEVYDILDDIRWTQYKSQKNQRELISYLAENCLPQINDGLSKLGYKIVEIDKEIVVTPLQDNLDHVIYRSLMESIIEWKGIPICNHCNELILEPNPGQKGRLIKNLPVYHNEYQNNKDCRQEHDFNRRANNQRTYRRREKLHSLLYSRANDESEVKIDYKSLSCPRAGSDA